MASSAMASSAMASPAMASPAMASPAMASPAMASPAMASPAMASGTKLRNSNINLVPFGKEERQPGYAQDRDIVFDQYCTYGFFLDILGSTIGCLGAWPCLPCPNPFREVNQGSVGLVTRFGQVYKTVDPGLVEVNVCTESLKIVDVKVQIAAIDHQRVITRDIVSLYIDSVIYFQINDPYRAAFEIVDLRQALIERARTAIRQVVGAREVNSVVADHEAIGSEIAEIVGEVAGKWGARVESIRIKDIYFTSDVATPLSLVAQQKVSPAAQAGSPGSQPTP